MTHRQIPQNRLYARLKRMHAKAFNAFLPEALHAVLRKHAQGIAEEEGGKCNINKVLIRGLLDRFGADMDENEKKACEDFLADL